MFGTNLGSLLRPLFYFLCSNLKANPVDIEYKAVTTVLPWIIDVKQLVFDLLGDVVVPVIVLVVLHRNVVNLSAALDRLALRRLQ